MLDSILRTRAGFTVVAIIAAFGAYTCMYAFRRPFTVGTFAGQELSDDVMARINTAIASEADRLIAERVLKERPDWLAVIYRRRLYVAFGAPAVQQLSRDLKNMGAL